ncbi:class I SAM-dependent methyltransferase [Gloeobacter kilaueensis]|uniref:O-methyltransferase n=1 Tax=Gloeobacter kilaueensis (strain ATCC BAA-2537 / CCAP 1431/1 / ULC 316 / JS1) TaxID=1183438 RepID=U5QJT6_GLOK1|nr:class I SAM-dependent methyltransferase [Gloeobacter kilaueensis]AGY57854.1 hypothetical protein GKIL_1608 [Gloeobacter kilaueensis JS1]
MINKVIDAIKAAEAEGLLSADADGILTGFSGKKLVGALQRIASLFAEQAGVCYLEVGVFQGLTLLSVASACRSLPSYGIDNFAFFDPEGKNLAIIKDRMAQLNVQNAVLINKDYEDALETLSTEIGDRKVALYLVDGPHDYRSQLMCLELVIPYLHQQAVIVVDDSNYRHVRQANRDFLVTHPEFKLAFEAYSACHPVNASAVQQQESRNGWWNGVNIIVRDLEQLLPPMYPPTERDRKLFENEHIVHAAAMAEYAPEAVGLLSRTDVVRFLASAVRLYTQVRNSRLHKNARHNNMNTYSMELPKARYNSLVK